MQLAKDSFYMALRSRLATVNPERTILIGGATEAAILVSANEPVTSAKSYTDCFYLQFGAAKVVRGASPLMAVDVSVGYWTRGFADGGCDRGRGLAALDSELLQACVPRSAAKCDYTKYPLVELGTNVFWSEPQLGEVVSEGTELSRTAKMTVYFYPEERVG